LDSSETKYKMKPVVKMIIKLKIDFRRLVVLFEYFFIRWKNKKNPNSFDENLENYGESDHS